MSNVFHGLVVEPKQENIGQSDARLIGRLEERARQAMFRTRGSCYVTFLGGNSVLICKHQRAAVELSAFELIDTGLMELSAAREVAGACQMESKEQMMERKPDPSIDCTMHTLKIH